MTQHQPMKALRRPRTGQAVIAASLAVNLLSLAMPLVMLQIFDRVVPNETLATLMILMIGLGVVMLLDFILKVCRIVETTHAAENFELSASARVVGRLLNARPSAHSDVRSVDRFEALSSIALLRDQYSGEGRLIAIDLPFILIFVLAVAWIGGPLAIVLVASFGVLCVASLILRAEQRRVFADRRSIDGRRYSFFAEAVQKAWVIKANCMETQMLRRYERLQEQSVAASRRLSVVNGMSQAFSATMSQATLAAMALSGGYMVIQGSLGLAELAACTLLGGRAIQPMLKLTSLWVQAESAKAAEDRCGELLKLPQRSAPVGEPIEGRVELDRVAYQPEDRAEPVFRDVSFSCAPGECVAITGDDGTGKSSLLRLILGEQAPTEGRVLIDGHDAERFLSCRGSGKIAYVDQSPTIFDASIERNLTLSNDPERIAAAFEFSRSLGLDGAVNRLPNGFETIIGGNGGTPLPEGTLQVISLARALAMKPRILLFNEANNAMDRPSDEAALNALKALRGRMTIIMITRRPSYVAIADRQINLSSGGATTRELDLVPAFDAITSPKPKQSAKQKPKPRPKQKPGPKSAPRGGASIEHLVSLRDRLLAAQK